MRNRSFVVPGLYRAFLVLSITLFAIVGPARANLIANGDFSTGELGTNTITNWSTGGSSGSVLLLNSSSLAQLGSACYNVTGTGRFVAFGAANTPNDGQLSQTFSRLLKNHLTTPDSL